MPSSVPAMNADQLKHLIREVPDFPKPGILFYDITTLRISAAEACKERHWPALVSAARCRERASYQETSLRRRLHDRRGAPVFESGSQAGPPAIPQGRP